MEGVEAIVVNVISASGLPAHDRNGFSDPYVCLAIETGERMDKPKKNRFRHHTHVEHKSLDPSWFELFTLAVREKDAHLRLYVFDHNLISSDAFLCWGQVAVQEVQDAEGYLHEHEFKLFNSDGGEAGSLIASVTYGTPQKEVPPARLFGTARDRKKQEAKEKLKHKIDKVPPKSNVGEDAIEAARKLGFNGRQVDRAFKYYNMVDKEGLGKITYADFDTLQTKIQRKRNRIGYQFQKGMMSGMMDDQRHYMFNLADKNEDGFLTFAEFLSLWKDMEMQLMGKSYNPIKNNVNRFAVMKQAMQDARAGNTAPYTGHFPKERGEN